MREYIVIKTDTGSAESGKIWAIAPSAQVDVCPWGASYRPATYGQLVCTDTDFWAHMVSVEKKADMRAVAAGIHPQVWLDSAMEMFLMPLSETDNRYMNFEFNSRGALYVGIGHNRYDGRLLADTDIRIFQIRNTMEDTGEPGMVRWSVTCRIPFSFLAEQYGAHDFSAFNEMRGNFYKCGDKTAEPHLMCWSCIGCKEEDFHRPEYFGRFSPNR